MRLIGIEEHFLTGEVREAWKAIGLEATDPSVALHSGVVERRLLDLAEEQLALMDETGLDIQVLSLTAPALHELEPDGANIARCISDGIAEVIARHSSCFQALATLPIAMPEEAAEELDRCVRTFGLKGVAPSARESGRHDCRTTRRTSLSGFFATALLVSLQKKEAPLGGRASAHARKHPLFRPAC